MIVNIYDVNHGFCGYVRDGLTGANILIDCGYDGGSGFHPVDEILSVHGPIGGLVIQNYDEDHLDGLPHLLRTVGPTPAAVLFGNPSLSTQQLLSLSNSSGGADAGRPTRFKPSSPSPTDAVRDGSAKLGHPVQNVTREHGLTPLPR